ncbi:MAG: FecR domain-containing protein [Bacteroidota bacterium]
MKPWETDETFLSRWLNGELTEAEKQTFEADPEYASYVATAQALQPFEVAPYQEKAELEKVMQRIKTQPEKAAKTVPFRRNWWVAAAAILLVLIGFAWWQFGSQSSPTEILAEERMDISLPDGSTIVLPAGSKVSYLPDDWANHRLVKLEGEAFFQVAKGQRFDIELKQGKVSILGTSFSIDERPDTVEVVCFTGRVQVEAFGEKHLLEKGMGVLAVRQQAALMQQTSLSQPTWLADKVQLQNVPLREALDQLREIYQLEITGAVDQEKIVNTVFPVDDVETALSQVLGPLNLVYQLDTTQKIVIIEEEQIK